MDLQSLSEIVKHAYAEKTSLHIRGGDSKSFYGRELSHLPDLDVKGFSGLIHYEPGELVVQVKAGTPLQDLVKVLDAENQILAFEPPIFDGNATVGGMLSSGISGSRRPYGGAVRDHVLGVDIINGKGETLSFGGQVMKNVAGYDVSRLLVGAMGCLGVVTEASFKVLPKPECERTQKIELSSHAANERMQSLTVDAPLASASAYFKHCLYVRFSGAEQSVQRAIEKFGGEAVDSDFWQRIDSLSVFDEPFDEGQDLWRVSTTPGNSIFLKEASLIDWGGGQRWLLNPEFDPRQVFGESKSEGHLTLLKTKKNVLGSELEQFQPLSGLMLKLHQDLKQQFDPAGILNPNKMYSAF